jgi:hypothetical protein
MGKALGLSNLIRQLKVYRTLMQQLYPSCSGTRIAGVVRHEHVLTTLGGSVE